MEDGCSGQADLQPIPITSDLYQDSTPSQRGSYDKKHDCRIFLEETAPDYVDNVSPAEIDIRNTKEVFSSVEKGDLQNLWAEPRAFNENWTGFLNSKSKSELIMDIEHSPQNFQDQVKFLESQDRNSSPNPLSSTQTILKKTRKRVTIAEEHSSVDEEMVFFHPKRCKLPHQNEDELREVARNIVRNAMTEVQNRLDQSAMDFQEIDIAEERPVVFMPHLDTELINSNEGLPNKVKSRWRSSATDSTFINLISSVFSVLCICHKHDKKLHPGEKTS